MNKSKFLKKSLAALMAIMMVVAMIPVGASAAATPAISKVTVGGETATLSGTDYSAEITNPGANAVPVTIQFKDGIGIAYHSDGSINDATSADGVYSFNFTADELTAKKATFKVFDTDNVLVGTYTVSFTVKPKNGDTSVKDVTYEGSYGKATLEGDTYTITVPYGTTLNGDSFVSVALNASTSEVSGSTKAGDGTYPVKTGTEYDKKVSFVVVAENSSSQTYYVKVVRASGFTAFSDKDQTKVEISGVTEDFTDEKTVNVYLPYGYEPADGTNYYFTPSFTTGYPSVKVFSENVKGKVGSTSEVTSGKTVLDLTQTEDISDSDYTKYIDTLTLQYTGVTENEAWTVNYLIPKKDDVAAIKSLSIGTFEGKIDGTNITIELPKSVRNDAAKTMVVGASNGSNVLVVGTTINGDVTSNNAVALPNTGSWFADGKNNFTLRVTAAKAGADGKIATKDYNLTIKTAEAQAAQITGILLQDASSKKNEYVGEINQSSGVITFAVPYANKDTASLTGWKIFYTLSNGAEVVSSDLAKMKSGSALAGNEDFFPGVFNGKVDTTADPISVMTPDVNAKSYKVVVKNLAASTGTSLTGVKLSTETKFNDVTDDNSKKATVSGRKLTVNVPYSEYAAYDEASVVGTLSEGAKLYYVNTLNENKLAPVDTMDAEDDEVTNKLPSVNTYAYGDEKTPLTLVVVSEGAAADAAGKVFGDEFKQGNVGMFSTYTLTVKQNAPRTGAALTGLSVYDAVSKKTIKGTIDKANNAVSIKLPYYYGGNTQPLALYLDYTTTGGESVRSDKLDVLKTLTIKNDGTVDATKSTALVADNSANTLSVSTNEIEKIIVGSEKLNGNAPATTVEYDLTVSFDAPKTGATLESVTINGVTARPSGNKVTINLPYATEITHLVPKFVVSENAFVVDASGPVSADAAYNFTTDKMFSVISEDASNMTIYTVSVTTSTQFTDVKPGDWFYDDVMRAASLGIVGGIGNNLFAPMNNVTRGQFALMLARMEGFVQADYADETPFSDVAAGTEMAAAIAYCADKGYIGGYEDTTFKPNATLTREAMAKIICVSMGYEEVTTVGAPYADDASIANWAKGYVYACTENNMMGGVGNNKFNPKGTANRAQAATVLVRMHDAK